MTKYSLMLVENAPGTKKYDMEPEVPVLCMYTENFDAYGEWQPKAILENSVQDVQDILDTEYKPFVAAGHKYKIVRVDYIEAKE